MQLHLMPLIEKQDKIWSADHKDHVRQTVYSLFTVYKRVIARNLKGL